MPHMDIVEFLLGKTNLTEADYLELVELRKAFLMKEIRQVGQTKLSSVFHGGTVIANWLDRCKSAFADQKISPSTRGVFIVDEDRDKNHGRSQEFLIYGFTQTGMWIKACIKFSVFRSTISDYQLNVSHTDAGSLVKEYPFLTPQRIFEALGDILDEHVERRELLLKRAQEMQWHVWMENKLLTVGFGK